MAAITTPSLEEIDKIGEAAEQEYEAELTDDANATLSVPGSKPKRIRLSTGQRMRLVEDFRKGKLDKYYSVTIDKKRPGEFRITKRRKPLDTPEIEVTAAPDNIAVHPATTTQIPVVEPVKQQTKSAPKTDKLIPNPEKVNIEFYAMQNNINNSLTREIQAVMEKCNKIERKMKEQRAEAKSKRKAQPEPVEYEYEYSDGEPEPDTAARTCGAAEPPSPEPVQQQLQALPGGLHLNSQYRMFNARSRINLLRDFR